MNRMYNNIRPILVSLFSFILFAYVSPAIAQINGDEVAETPEIDPSQQMFSFVYVAWDKSMSLQTLLDNMRDAYNHALVDGPTIFYLSCGSQPVVVCVNTPNDNRDNYEEGLLEVLRQQIEYSVDGLYDKQRIHELLEENNFVDDNGNLKYKRTDFAFHVGQKFWDMANNETLIASLFFELDMNRYIVSESFNANVYCPRAMDMDVSHPFGVMNPDNVNEKIRIRKIYEKNL